MALFDYKAEVTKVPPQDKTEELYISKYLASHYQKISNLEDDLMRVPTQEEFFFLQSDTAFNAFTFIPLVAKHYPIKELYATTYSLSRKVVDALLQMHDEGLIEQITILVSDSIIKRSPVIMDQLRAIIADKPNFTVLYAWSHSKVCLLRTHDDHYVIEGSGNWSENAQYEQYVFANSKGLYDFRMKLFTESKLKTY